MDNNFFNKGLTFCQLQLSNTIRRLWVEHVLWTRFFIISTDFDLPDLELVTQRLLQNPVDFARVLKPYYGEQAAMKFEGLLTEHLMIGGKLVNAAKEGNTEEADKQRKLWYANAEDIAIFLSCINPCWSKFKWRDLLFDHLRMTEDEAVLIITGKYEKGIKQYDAIQAEAFKMADVMTSGIICQF